MLALDDGPLIGDVPAVVLNMLVRQVGVIVCDYPSIRPSVGGFSAEIAWGLDAWGFAVRNNVSAANTRNTTVALRDVECALWVDKVFLAVAQLTGRKVANRPSALIPLIRTRAWARSQQTGMAR